MNNIKIILPLLIGSTLALGLFLGTSLSTDVSPFNKKETASTNAQKLNDILYILDKKYVDSIDKEDLFEEAISDMLHKLDPHSNYIAARDLARLNESIQGHFGGIGVRFSIIRDTLCITNVLPNSPSERAGVLSQDQIIKIDGEVISDSTINNEKVMKALKGLENTEVEITVLRDGFLKDITITRGSIPVNSVLASYMLTDKTGYIQLQSFSEKTTEEFYKAALQLKAEKMENLIVDLRFNGGGLMSAAINICDMFLDKGLPIVSTKGKSQPDYTEYAANPPVMGNIQLAILINSSSASASEIVAGAIQDNDRGTIIGRRSFGKGLVQQDMLLKDSSNLRLTVARYFTPTGRSIQRPYSEGFEEYMMDERDRYNNGELYHLDSTLMVDSLKYTTPGGKVVYGGGGIMPDIFVPLDTTGGSFYYTQLQYGGVFNAFAFDYVKNNKESLAKYTSIYSFRNDFKVTSSLLDDFKEYAQTYYNIKAYPNEFERSTVLIKREIKANIANQIWVDNAAQLMRADTDKEVQKALEFLEK
ncbi:carboxyl-terminal processing protease [Lishizhenia tianjinensis]|uniref:Carboxyl-terminal processing protease n=1 Tax=Lishizhenia tianjinensis TaxID=477690 RepID=A0A1I7B3P2_9FLAO|nr:S41 family peptidase [Lishizhenia tianjinensis]SFT81826.1 carboxyl-terminal processing protease [Lishizhenia tianjinensis]